MEKVIWFLIVVAFLVFGMYWSTKFAIKAEKLEKGQGEYLYYIFTACLLVVNAVMFGLYLKSISIYPWLLAFSFFVVEFIVWASLGTGKTHKAKILAWVLTIIALLLAIKVFLLA